MEKLLKLLSKELLRLKVLDSVSEKHAGYLQGRIEELEQVIDLINEFKQENND